MARIILIDDEKDLADLTKVALANKGHEVRIFYGVPKVFQEIKTWKPDLILMDIMMPGTSGPEAVKEFRKDPLLRKIPVIFMTALIAGQEDIETAGINIEGTKYKSLGKPYEIDHLLKEIEDTLNKTKR